MISNLLWCLWVIWAEYKVLEKSWALSHGRRHLGAVSECQPHRSHSCWRTRSIYKAYGRSLALALGGYVPSLKRGPTSCSREQRMGRTGRL